MIDVDISHVWGAFSLPELLAVEPEVARAHLALSDEGGCCRPWLRAAQEMEGEKLLSLKTLAGQIRDRSRVLVVAGPDRLTLGLRSVIELLQGPEHNLEKGNGNPRILFAGNSLSSRQWLSLEQQLEHGDVSVLGFFREEDETAAAAFRHLVRGLRVENAGRIFVTALLESESWELMELPEWAEDFPELTPAGLLTLEVAGIDTVRILGGAKEARRTYDLRSFENPLWLYAAVRNVMRRAGKGAEYLALTEPCMDAFGAWWQQLFAGEAWQDHGLLPCAGMLLPEPPEVSGYEGYSWFETVLRFQGPARPIILEQGSVLDDTREDRILKTLDLHEDRGLGVISMDCGALTCPAVGELLFFMRMACALSSGIRAGAEPEEADDAPM